VEGVESRELRGREYQDPPSQSGVPRSLAAVDASAASLSLPHKIKQTLTEHWSGYRAYMKTGPVLLSVDAVE
jgi:hypothetical protein